MCHLGLKQALITIPPLVLEEHRLSNYLGCFPTSWEIGECTGTV